MASSNAKTVGQYLKELPPERKKDLQKIRQVILKNLPSGYKEVMQYGMISYVVPFSVLPETYNNQPLGYVALAAQKNNISIYLMAVYGDKFSHKKFISNYKKSGKKLDMGKSCVRAKTADDFALDVIGSAVAALPMKDYIAYYKKVKTRSAKKSVKKNK